MNNTLVKQSEDVYQDTEFGKLPREWEIVTINEVSEKMRAGGTPSRKNPEYWGGNIPFVLIEDMTSINLFLDKTKETINEKGLQNSSAWIVPPNSLLLSMYATIGATAINTISMATNQAILAIIPKSNFDIMYGAYSLQFFSERLVSQNVQSTQKNVNKGIVSSFKIPLPPLPEQHAIAHVPRTVQEAKEKTDAVIAATKALKVAMMKHLFTYGPVPPEEADKVALKETEIGQVPERWEILKLGELCQNEKHAIQTGPFGSQLHSSDYVKSGIPVVMPRDITYNGISTEKIAHIDISDHNRLKRHSLKINDIVLGRRGELGRRAIIQKDQEGWICGTGCLRIRILNDRVIPDFLNIFFSTPQIIEWLSNEAIGTTMQNLSSSILKSTPIVIPSIEEQKKIIDLFNAIDQKLAAEQSRKEALDTLFASLLHDLMTAKIRVSTA